jgi:AraC-like DNA-binding protein
MELTLSNTLVIGWIVACLLFVLHIMLVVYFRRMIDRKNNGLFRQIKEQDRLKDEYIQLSIRYESLSIKMSQSEQTETKQNPACINEEDIMNQQFKLVDKLEIHLQHHRRFANPEIDPADLAVELGTSLNILNDAVRLVAGKSIREFINAIRLDEAKYRLEDADDYDEPITAIAETCGFKTPRNFRLQFNDRYNLPPETYRKIAQKNNIDLFR